MQKLPVLFPDHLMHILLKKVIYFLFIDGKTISHTARPIVKIPLLSACIFQELVSCVIIIILFLILKGPNESIRTDQMIL